MKRSDFRRFVDITTRWMDNDVYGHVNNVVYYSFFDTAVNQALIEDGVLDIHAGGVIGLVVETSCTYARPIAFPDRIAAGVRVARIGTSSVRYEVGVFRDGEDDSVAHGYFVHVYVDRSTKKPTPIPGPLRAALERLGAQSVTQTPSP
jgi:acyl-CoA thioester hydrolase